MFRRPLFLYVKYSNLFLNIENNEEFHEHYFQEMNVLLLMLHISGIWAASNNTSYKEMIQGYLTGQLSSVLGSYQVETLKREFKSFTGLMEKNFQDFKENIEIEMNKIKDRTSTTKEFSNIKSIIYIYR